MGAEEVVNEVVQSSPVASALREFKERGKSLPKEITVDDALNVLGQTLGLDQERLDKLLTGFIVTNDSYGIGGKKTFSDISFQRIAKHESSGVVEGVTKVAVIVYPNGLVRVYRNWENPQSTQSVTGDLLAMNLTGSCVLNMNRVLVGDMKFRRVLAPRVESWVPTQEMFFGTLHDGLIVDDLEASVSASSWDIGGSTQDTAEALKRMGVDQNQLDQSINLRETLRCMIIINPQSTPRGVLDFLAFEESVEADSAT